MAAAIATRDFQDVHHDRDRAVDRGTSVNQVEGDGPVLVTAGTGVPTSGLILGPD
jgi:hypothetical protein